MSITQESTKQRASPRDVTCYLIIRDIVKCSIAALGWEAGFNQSVVAAENCCRISDAFCFEISHRTGAGMLSRSRAVSDNHLVARKLSGAIHNLTVRNVQGTFDMAGLVGFMAAHVNQHCLVLL